jgi:hypothetical protein
VASRAPNATGAPERVRQSRNWALAAVALVAVVGCHKPRPLKLRWAIGVATFDATALGLAQTRTPDPFVDAIRPGPLVIPTYDGSNQATHPDVLVERDAAGRVQVTMAMTPYPFSDNRIENPSLVVSSDGMTFTPMPGALSPLVPPPPYDHNDDPDLRRDPRTGEYELLYLESMRPNRQTMVALRSRDKVTWTRHDAIVYDLKKPAPFMVSPAAIDDAGTTHLFYVNTVTGTLWHLTSSDGTTWDPTAATPVALDLGKVRPWHVDVVRGETGFALLISGYDTQFVYQNLYLATSPDLATWTLRPQPLLAYSDPALGATSLYRSSGVVDHGTLIVWYAMQVP